MNDLPDFYSVKGHVQGAGGLRRAGAGDNRQRGSDCGSTPHSSTATEPATVARCRPHPGAGVSVPTVSHRSAPPYKSKRPGGPGHSVGHALKGQCYEE